MPMTTFLAGVTFDAELTKAMGVAFDTSCQSLGLPDASGPLAKLLAAAIVEAARGGERDPASLHEAAMRAAASAG